MLRATMNRFFEQQGCLASVPVGFCVLCSPYRSFATSSSEYDPPSSLLKAAKDLLAALRAETLNVKKEYLNAKKVYEELQGADEMAAVRLQQIEKSSAIDTKSSADKKLLSLLNDLTCRLQQVGERPDNLVTKGKRAKPPKRKKSCKTRIGSKSVSPEGNLQVNNQFVECPECGKVIANLQKAISAHYRFAHQGSRSPRVSTLLSWGPEVDCDANGRKSKPKKTDKVAVTEKQRKKKELLVSAVVQEVNDVYGEVSTVPAAPAAASVDWWTNQASPLTEALVSGPTPVISTQHVQTSFQDIKHESVEQTKVPIEPSLQEGELTTMEPSSEEQQVTDQSTNQEETATQTISSELEQRAVEHCNSEEPKSNSQEDAAPTVSSELLEVDSTSSEEQQKHHQ